MRANPNVAHTILRCRQVQAKTGLGRSSIYSRISKQLFTKPVFLGGAVGWPEDEVNALNAARIAEKSDEEIRALVRRLEAARRSAMNGHGVHRALLRQLAQPRESTRLAVVVTKPSGA